MMSRLQYLWIVSVCLFITGCTANMVSPQMVAVPASYERPKSTQAEIVISDLSNGSASVVLWNKPGAEQPIAIHNGSNVKVEVQTDASVTGVALLSPALTPVTLHRNGSGRWRGTFQYWDLSNVLNSRTNLTVQLLSAKGSIEKVISITTVHDS